MSFFLHRLQVGLLLGLVFSCVACTPRDANSLEARSIFTGSRVLRLVLASEEGDVKTIDALVKDGVDVNAKGRYNVTPLLRTLVKRNKEGYLALLRHGADPNILDANGFAVMNEAAFDSEPFWLSEALKNRGKPNLVDDGNPKEHGWTPIYYAISHKRLQNVKLLMKAGADLNRQDAQKSRPLLWAAQRSAYDIVFSLVEAGADFRQQNSADTDLIGWISDRNDTYVPDEDQKVWFNKTVDLLKSKGAKFELFKN